MDTESGCEKKYLMSDIVAFKNTTTNDTYRSLKQAIAEASSGDVIIQTRNITEKELITIPTNVEVTVDTKEYILEFIGENMFENNGTLKLKSNSDATGIKYSGTGKFLTNNGTFINQTGKITINSLDNTIVNNSTGTIKLNGGTITNSSDNNDLENSGYLEINDGNNRLKIHNATNSEFTMNGGKLLTYRSDGNTLNSVNDGLANIYGQIIIEYTLSGILKNHCSKYYLLDFFMLLLAMNSCFFGCASDFLVKSSGSTSIIFMSLNLESSVLSINASAGEVYVNDSSSTSINSVTASGTAYVELINFVGSSVIMKDSANLDYISGTLTDSHVNKPHGNYYSEIPLNISEGYTGTINLGTNDGNVDNDQLVFNRMDYRSVITGYDQDNYTLNIYDMTLNQYPGDYSIDIDLAITAKVTEYEEGYNFKVVEENNKRTYYLSSESTIQNVTKSKSYNNLNEAFEEASSNDVLRLTDTYISNDFNDTIVIESGEKYTLDLNGNFIAEYGSMSEAAQYNNITKTMISYTNKLNFFLKKLFILKKKNMK